MDACERCGKHTIAGLVSRTKTDEDRHVQYTRAAVFDLLTRRDAEAVMDVHRRAEARANLRFSQRQVSVFLAQFWGRHAEASAVALRHLRDRHGGGRDNMSETKQLPSEPLAMRLEALRRRLAALDESATVEFFHWRISTGRLKPPSVFVPTAWLTRPRWCSLAAGGCSCANFAIPRPLGSAAGKRRTLLPSLQQRPLGAALCGGKSHGFSGVRRWLPQRRSINEIDQGDFADQTTNKSCTIAVEVTNACNLACPVCYSDARGDRKMPFALFKDYILGSSSARYLDSVQLTGGEACCILSFWEMVRLLA